MPGRFDGQAAQPECSHQAEPFEHPPHSPREGMFERARDQTPRHVGPPTTPNTNSVNRRHLRIEELLAPVSGHEIVRSTLRPLPFQPSLNSNPLRAPKGPRFAPYPAPTGHQLSPARVTETSHQHASSVAETGSSGPSHAQASLTSLGLESDPTLRPDWQ